MQALPDFIAGPEAMLFNSLEYLLVFLPLTVLVYFALNRHSGNAGSKAWLVLASLLFYGWWSLDYLWLLGTSILFNYCTARWLGRAVRYQRSLLMLAITANLALLGYYKYADFFYRQRKPVNRHSQQLAQAHSSTGHQLFHIHPDCLSG